MPTRPIPPAVTPKDTPSVIVDARDPLNWSEWWRRHDWIFKFVNRNDVTVTGGPEEAGRVSPKVLELEKELIGFLADKYYDVRSASCLALGKIGRNTPEVRGCLVKMLRDKNDEVCQSAVIALGMIKAVEASTAVRNILAEKRQDEGLRSWAAISLGLMGSDANLPMLQKVAGNSDTSDQVRTGAIIALGLLGDDRGAYVLLNIVMGNNKEELQAFAVSSLAKIGRTELFQGTGRRARTIDLVALFEDRLRNKEVKDEVRRAVALSLGSFGDPESSIKALEQACRLDRDRGVRGFAMLSLGQLCARLEAGSPVREEVREFLRVRLREEKENRVKGFAVLAVGLSGNDDAGRDLLDVFNSGAHKDVRAAAAVALGILKHKDAIDDLGAEVLKPRSGGEARGQACVALGMIGEPVASEFLKSVLNDVNVPYLKWMAATGLAILGDRSAIGDIEAKLCDRNAITREAAVRSLQYFRDESTIGPLLEQFRREKSDELRTMIVVSLGAIADGSRGVPPLRRVSRNLNWSAAAKMPAIDLVTKIF